MSRTPMDLEEELRQLAPAFKDGIEPPASLHAGVIARIDGRLSGEPRVRRQLWPSIAGVAIVLLAGSAVGAAVVIRGLHPTHVLTNHPSPTPVARPSATPMSQQLQVPDSTPVLLFHDPLKFDQIDGIAWDGSSTGRVGVNPEATSGILQNPVGTLWATTQDIRDRAGAIVATVKTNGKELPGMWADDGRHYCSMTPQGLVGPVGGVPTTLELTTVGQASRAIARLGSLSQLNSVGAVACSTENDRAVVVQFNSIGVGDKFWVVQLSTGRILWTRPSADIRASRDGRYIAEITYDERSRTSATTIYSSTGTVLARLAGRIEAFSWDGALAVQFSDYAGPVSIIKWRDGTAIWRGPSDGGFVRVVPEPGGQRLAVSVSNPSFPQTGGFPPADVYIVSPDGKAVELLTHVIQ